MGALRQAQCKHRKLSASKKKTPKGVFYLINLVCILILETREDQKRMMTLKQSFKTGLGFGLTSGVITTLGLIVGLYSGTHSEAVVLGGIFVIAVADALSDALGMHMSVESDKEKSTKQVWEATFYTFLFKFVFALTFAVPVLLFALSTAVWVSIGWGILLISIFSFYSEKQRGRNPWKMVLEHLLIAVLVIIATHYVGELVSNIRR